MTTTRSFRLTASIAAASIALVTVASFAAAAGPNGNGNGNGPNGNGNGPGAGTGTCAATCPNGGQPATLRQGAQHRGQGMVNQAQGARRGTGRQVPVTPAVLTADQRAMVAYMVEEEKLAHDVYVTLAAKYPADYQFARIANAETMHQTALRTLLTRYGLTDPTAGEAAGEFSTTAFQSLYNDLVASATTAANALDVGVSVEQRDIADLTTALNGLSAPDVVQVYTNLRNASQHHLAAFGG